MPNCFLPAPINFNRIAHRLEGVKRQTNWKHPVKQDKVSAGQCTEITNKKVEIFKYCQKANVGDNTNYKPFFFVDALFYKYTSRIIDHNKY